MGNTQTEDNEKIVSTLDIQEERQRALLLILVRSEDTPQTTQNRAQELEALVDTMGRLVCILNISRSERYTALP